MTTPRTGAEAFCDVLEQEGVECVFGLPGTQTVGLYDALRRSKIRAVVPTHELAAAFMAYGYARASGKVAVLLTIPGPGFAFAPAGLAEAKLDAVPVVHFTLTPSRGPTGDLAFQALDQAAIAHPLVKAVFRIESRAELPDVVRHALRVAAEPEAGPVFVEMTDAVIREELDSQSGERVDSPSATASSSGAPVEVIDVITHAKRPVLFVTDVFPGISDSLARLATTARIPVLVAPPGRGIVAEDHAWMLCCDDQRTQFDSIRSALALADVILVLGTRLTHVATAGFRLKFPADRVICISESGATLPHGYQAQHTVHASVTSVLAQLEQQASRAESVWTTSEMSEWRARFADALPSDPPEPVVNGGTAATFFAGMRAALPRDAIVMTDSGLHQALTRRHFPVYGATGLVFPAELQSMAFGLPAAIGAKLAQPNRVVAVVMGDGGFAMSGLELLTAARDNIPVIVIVFNDGKLNLIRLQQLREYGVAHGAEMRGPDFERFAEAVGVRYQACGTNAEQTVREAMASGETTLIEVIVGDSNRIRQIQAKSYARETVRRAIGPRFVNWIKKRLR